MREIEPAVSEAFSREEPLDPARGGGQTTIWLVAPNSSFPII